MRRLTTPELLNVWESCLTYTYIDKSLHLLSVANPGNDTGAIADLSIGVRDGMLFQLQEWMFGSKLVCLATCPECSEQIKWQTNLEDIYLKYQQPTIAGSTFNHEVDGFNIRFRLPNSHDLARVISNDIYRSYPKKLITDCILEVQHGQSEYETESLPDPVLNAISQRMEEEDPQAIISMLLNCPVCLHKWESRFDIMSYLWAEIDNWARRILNEVFVLARAFGWPESDILNMNPRRRQTYLDMLRS